MKRNIKVLLIALIVLALAGGTFAFAAANTIATPGKVGDGVATVSGYAITNVVYTLNSTTPNTLDSVAFTTSAAALEGKVKVQLVASTGDWYNCLMVEASPTAWTCSTTGLLASSIDQIRVVAASQ